MRGGAFSKKEGRRIFVCLFFTTQPTSFKEIQFIRCAKLSASFWRNSVLPLQAPLSSASLAFCCIIQHPVFTCFKPQKCHIGGLLIRNIRADGLTKLRCIANHVQHVIPDLKGQSQIGGVISGGNDAVVVHHPMTGMRRSRPSCRLPATVPRSFCH